MWSVIATSFALQLTLVPANREPSHSTTLAEPVARFESIVLPSTPRPQAPVPENATVAQPKPVEHGMDRSRAVAPVAAEISVPAVSLFFAGVIVVAFLAHRFFESSIPRRRPESLHRATASPGEVMHWSADTRLQRLFGPSRH